jgi:hypothetical protein
MARPPRPRVTRPKPDALTIEQNRERMSSYIYGNILVLAAVIGVDDHAIEHGSALLAVLATGVTTFLAHIVSHIVAHAIGHDPDDDDEARETVRDIVRGATPIVTSSLIPAVVFAAAWLWWPPAPVAQIVASVVLLVRIGFVGFYIQRLSGHRPSFLGLWSGIVLAGIAFVIVILKVTFTH